jgi:hypothetical protein
MSDPIVPPHAHAGGLVHTYTADLRLPTNEAGERVGPARERRAAVSEPVGDPHGWQAKVAREFAYFEEMAVRWAPGAAAAIIDRLTAGDASDEPTTVVGS